MRMGAKMTLADDMLKGHGRQLCSSRRLLGDELLSVSRYDDTYGVDSVSTLWVHLIDGADIATTVRQQSLTVSGKWRVIVHGDSLSGDGHGRFGAAATFLQMLIVIVGRHQYLQLGSTIISGDNISSASVDHD